MEGTPQKSDGTYAHECRIRDLYARRLSEFQPSQILIDTEYGFPNLSTPLRADMRTVDENDTIRVWEFKLFGSYDGLGQALTYLSLARLELNFTKPMRGVLAAFDFQPEIVRANDVLIFGLELVMIPNQLRKAGGIPVMKPPPATTIPVSSSIQVEPGE